MPRRKSSTYEAEVKAAWSKHEDADGKIAPAEQLVALLKTLKQPTTARDVVSVQGQICRSNRWQTLPEKITLADFRKFYDVNVRPRRQNRCTNELLVRRKIGETKKCTRNLLPGNYNYGLTQEADAEGAGVVVLNWVSGQRSESEKAGVSLIKMNIAAAKEGKCTARQVNEYLKENKNNPKLQRKDVKGVKPRYTSAVKRDPNFTYGLTKKGPNADMKTVLFPGKGNPCNSEDPEYVDVTQMVKKGRLPFPRSTYSSNRLAKFNRDNKTTSEDAPKQWKMSKFNSVRAKISQNQSNQES